MAVYNLVEEPLITFAINSIYPHPRTIKNCVNGWPYLNSEVEGFDRVLEDFNFKQED